MRAALLGLPAPSLLPVVAKEEEASSAESEPTEPAAVVARTSMPVRTSVSERRSPATVPAPILPERPAPAVTAETALPAPAAAAAPRETTEPAAVLASSPAPAAAPRFVLERAHVELASPAKTVGATSIAFQRALAPATTKITACYRTALPSMAGAVDGPGVLHVETNEVGVIVRARLEGAVGALAACIEGAVTGGRVASVDTGIASADVPVLFHAQ